MAGIYRNHGGWRVGESHPRSKLTTAQVWEIRKLHSEGVSYAALADLFKCGVSTVRDIVKYETRSMG